MKITRRNFLKGSLASLFLAGSGIPVYSSTKTKKNLVVIMLRGGMDALCAVPVIGDKDFEKRRKQLILDDTIKLNLVSKDTVNGLGPLDKIKSAINYLIFGGDLN